MTKKQKRHIIATLGTLLFMLLVLLLLWYMRLEAVAPEQEEGVEIAFAEMEEEPLPPASGEAAYAEEPTDAASAAPAQPAEAVATHPTPASPPEHIMSEEETLALARAKKEKEEREAAKRARKQQKEAEAIAKAKELGNLFGKTKGTNTSGDGTAQGSGSKGNPVGHGSSGGNSWSLSGRGIKGTLPQPSNDFQQEGRVLVEIRVNAAGNVISAVVKGGNISDKATQQLALEAARKAKFSEGDHDQIGTITYNFKFN